MTSSTSIRVFVAEDHQLTRLGLKFALEEQPDFELVGEEGDGDAVVEKVLATKPQLVLMDIELPGTDGIDACREIKRRSPEIRILMLTSHDNDNKIFASFASGADGYCMKTVHNEQLWLACRTVAAGFCWIDPTIAGRVLKGYVRAGSWPQDKPTGASELSLTAREIEVLRLIVEGLRNNAIAERLTISTDTVKSHISHVMEKLAVTDRTQAALKAVREGLI